MRRHHVAGGAGRRALPQPAPQAAREAASAWGPPKAEALGRALGCNTQGQSRGGALDALTTRERGARVPDDPPPLASPSVNAKRLPACGQSVREYWGLRAWFPRPRVGELGEQAPTPRRASRTDTEALGLRPWTGLDWTGLDSTGLGWTGLDWTGLGWAGLDWTGLGWAGLGRAGLDWTGLGWAGVRRNFRRKSSCQGEWEGFSKNAAEAPPAEAPPAITIPRGEEGGLGWGRYGPRGG